MKSRTSFLQKVIVFLGDLQGEVWDCAGSVLDPPVPRGKYADGRDNAGVAGSEAREMEAAAGAADARGCLQAFSAPSLKTSQVGSFREEPLLTFSPHR